MSAIKDPRDAECSWTNSNWTLHSDDCQMYCLFQRSGPDSPTGKTDYHENNWERGRVSAAFNRAVSIFILINNAQQSAYLDLTDDIDLFGQIVSGVWDEERERNWENENELKVREGWRETALKAKQSIMLILLICFAYCYENNKQT